MPAHPKDLSRSRGGRGVRNRIFVSVAGYRDAELVPTVHDLLEKAANPSSLTVVVLNQDEKRLRRSALPSHRKLVVDNCHHSEARGVGWARARVQSRFNGEGFYFQVDAHHRFERDWDEKLRAQFARLPSPRPILSSYLPSYWYENGTVKFSTMLGGPMVFAGFNHDGMHLVQSRPYTEDPGLEPIPGSYLSGHYIFSTGEFVEKVPYDPDFYFTGEEQSLSVRAFTHGFDVFNPVRCFAWHHYGRPKAHRHWNDHTGTASFGFPTLWTEEHGRSLTKWGRLFGLEPLISPNDGLGTVRSLADFEAWTGVNAHWQVAHPGALSGAHPPVAGSSDWAVTEKLLVERTIEMELPPLSTVDTRTAESVFIAIRDATPRDALTRRVSPAEYSILRRRGFQATVRYKQAPLTLTVWPLLATGWGNKYEETLRE